MDKQRRKEDLVSINSWGGEYKAQRVICVYVNSVGGIHNVVVTDSLLREARPARQKYDTYLENDTQK